MTTYHRDYMNRQNSFSYKCNKNQGYQFRECLKYKKIFSNYQPSQTLHGRFTS